MAIARCVLPVRRGPNRIRLLPSLSEAAATGCATSNRPSRGRVTERTRIDGGRLGSYVGALVAVRNAVHLRAGAQDWVSPYRATMGVAGQPEPAAWGISRSAAACEGRSTQHPLRPPLPTPPAAPAARPRAPRSPPAAHLRPSPSQAAPHSRARATQGSPATRRTSGAT